MPGNTHFAQVAWDAALDAILAKANGGTVVVYDGEQPANPDVAVTTQNPLVTMGLSSPAAAPAVSGVAVMNAITQGTAVATGTGSWFRVYGADGAAVWDGSVGNGDADMNFPSTGIYQSSQYNVAAWSVHLPVES